jgi:hypothetical protein
MLRYIFTIRWSQDHRKGSTKKLKHPVDQSEKAFFQSIVKKIEDQKEAEERLAFRGHVIR